MIFKKLLVKLNKNEELYLVNSKDFIKYTNNWEFNRPPDKNRVDKIKETIKNNTYVNSPIYIAEILDENKIIKYLCYDGNHRREAFINSKPINIVINLIKNADNDIIKERFLILNSGCPVPELYLNNTDLYIKNITEYLIDKICIRYKNHKSPSNKPRKPNFNRDLLNDILFTYIKSNKIYDGEELFQKIKNLNELYKNGKHININKFSDKIKLKCKNNNCYLFLKDNFTEDL